MTSYRSLAGAVVAMISTLALAGCGRATLEFTLADATSGSFVWAATARCQDRSLPLFFQSDRGPVPQRFVDLEPGPSELVIEAAGYRPVRLPVRLRRGTNRLPEPVRMTGIDIPGLDHWIVTESADGRDLLAELRPVRSDGTAVLNHPCLPLRVAVLITVQEKNGTPTLEKTIQGAARGKVLFQGQVPWTWNALIEKTFRYSLRIAGSRIESSAAPYRVVDYLVVTPIPEKITEAEVDRLLAGFRWENPEEAIATLAAERDRVRWQLVTSWNVKAGAP